MCRPRVLIGIALLGVLTGVGWFYTQNVRAATTLTAQDTQDITQLYSIMYQGSDLRDLNMWVSAFADDGTFKLPTGDQVVGKKALAEWRAKSFGGKTGDSKRRHWFGLIRVSPGADGGATARAYWSVLDVSKKQATIMSTGTVDDVFVKTPSGWKFKVHVVRTDEPGE
jgi:3-phenylpropionate/cinnamic acid dioxygenase small subunit